MGIFKKPLTNEVNRSMKPSPLILLTVLWFEHTVRYRSGSWSSARLDIIPKPVGH